MMNLRLSHSQVRTFLECPRIWEWRYLLKKPEIRTSRLLAGSVYHAGIEYALKKKMNNELIFDDEIKTIINNKWDAETSSGVYADDEGDAVETRSIEWGEDDPEILRNIVSDLACFYNKTIVPTLEPVAVEKKLEGIVGGVPFLGYADVILKGPGVIDHKLAKRRMDQGTANKDLQISAYACLLKSPIWGAFHQALDQKKQDINIVTTIRTKGDMDWYEMLVEKVAQAMQTGIYPPNPLTWKCGPTCSYELECRILMG